MMQSFRVFVQVQARTDPDFLEGMSRLKYNEIHDIDQYRSKATPSLQARLKYQEHAPTMAMHDQALRF